MKRLAEIAWHNVIWTIDIPSPTPSLPLCPIATKTLLRSQHARVVKNDGLGR